MFYVSIHQDQHSVTQVAADWQELPFTEITVSTNGTCITDFEPLFARTWPGTLRGCDCRGIWSSRINFWEQNSLNIGGCSYNQTRAGCRSVLPFNQKVLGNLGGYSICGKRGGSTFIEMQRPIDMEGNCPDGFSPCNPKALPDQRVCVETGQQCPINDIKFVQALSNDSDYEYLRAGERWIAYSRKAPSLPMM